MYDNFLEDSLNPPSGLWSDLNQSTSFAISSFVRKLSSIILNTSKVYYDILKIFSAAILSVIIIFI